MSTAYNKAQLLDEQNNPITPYVNIDGIYEKGDEDNKNSLDIVYQTDYDKIIINNDEITGSNGSVNYNIITGDKGMTVITDITQDGHKLIVHRANLKDLIDSWYGTVINNNFNFNIFCSNSAECDYIDNKLSIKNGIIGDSANIQAIYDYNTTNFQSANASKYCAVMHPSNDYIWVEALDSWTGYTFSVWGFSGFDAPQEIEMTSVITGDKIIMHSKYPFGLAEFGTDSEDTRQNTNINSSVTNGYEYKVFIIVSKA